MSHRTQSTKRNTKTSRVRATLAALLCIASFVSARHAHAGTPVSLFRSFAGNTDFVGAAASFRTQPNTANACALAPSATGTLSGLPATATLRVAYLYWAGSGSAVDAVVTFAGTPVTADRTFTETFPFGGTDYDFFSGVADVTALVSGNGAYTVSGLSVDSNAPFCGVQAVLAGWALVVIFDDAGEPLRVVNLFDGFEFFRNSTLTLTPNNFSYAPCASPPCAQLAHITWEGDDTLGGTGESLRFEGRTLTDAVNPPTNQFNSTVNIASPPAAEWGVDFDVYDVTGDLTPGQNNAVSVYSAAGDLVLLSAEVFSVSNAPVADLEIAKSHSGDFVTGSGEDYTLRVRNNGPGEEPGAVVVDDPLPAGLSYVGGGGSGWTCSEAGGVAQCVHAGPLAAGGFLPDLTLTVRPDPAAIPAVTNTATTRGTLFDNVAANNTASDPTNVIAGADVVVVKSLAVLDDPVRGTTNPIAIPGSTVEYRIVISHSASAASPADNITVLDDLGPQIAAGNFAFDPDGYDTVPGRGIEVTAPNINAGAPTALTNTADADAGAYVGDVVSVTGIRLDPGESATVRFRVVVQ